MSHVFGFILAALAQQPADRVAIDQVESWYKISQGDEQRGWMAETIRRVSGEHRYEYALKSQCLAPEKGEDHRRTVRLTARLDDAFAVVRLDAVLTKDDETIEISLTPVEGGTRVDAIPEDGTLRQWKIAAGAEVHALPSLMFFALRQSGRLAKAGRIETRVLDPFAERDPAATVTLTVKAMEPFEYEGRKPKVTPVVFGKAPPALDADFALTEAKIDKYGRPVEAVTRGGFRIALVKDEPAATAGMIRFLHDVPEGGPKRDPFARPGRERQSRLPGRDAEVPADALASALARASQDLEEIARLREAGLPEEAQALYLKGILQWRAMARTATALRREAELARLADLREGLEKAWPGASMAAAEARRDFLAAEQAFEDGNIPALAGRIRRLAAPRPEVEGRPEAREIAGYAAALKPLLAKAEVRRELAAKTLVCTGTVIGFEETEEPAPASATVLGARVGGDSKVRFLRPLRYAVINNVRCQVGDVIEGATVDSIDVTDVWVRYKGELRKLR